MNQGDVTSMVAKFYAYIHSFKGVEGELSAVIKRHHHWKDRLWLFALSLFLACFTLLYC